MHPFDTAGSLLTSDFFGLLLPTILQGEVKAALVRGCLFNIDRFTN